MGWLTHRSNRLASVWGYSQIRMKLNSACKRLWIPSARLTNYGFCSSTCSRTHASAPLSNYGLNSGRRSPRISSWKPWEMLNKAATKLSCSWDRFFRVMGSTSVTTDYRNLSRTMTKSNVNCAVGHRGLHHFSNKYTPDGRHSILNNGIYSYRSNLRS